MAESADRPEVHEEIRADARHEFIERAATDLFIAVWRGIQRGEILERSPIADSALELRDRLNSDWPENPDWLPETLQTEQ